MVNALKALVTVCVGCGSTGSFVCPSNRLDVGGEADAVVTVACQGAQAFAARDTAGLVPTQEEVDRYFDRWLRVINAEPILERRVPQRHYVGYGAPIPVYTRNQLVIDAWTRRQVETGDGVFDALVSELTPPRVVGVDHIELGDGSWLFSLRVEGTFNEQLLSERLRETSSRTEEPQYPYRDDGTWSWELSVSRSGDDSDTARVDFSFGWGDCFVACFGMHAVRAIVPPKGAARVYDLGGDPLPDGWHLAPTTVPWPP